MNVYKSAEIFNLFSAKTRKKLKIRKINAFCLRDFHENFRGSWVQRDIDTLYFRCLVHGVEGEFDFEECASY
jgi:hypothetical protein